MSARNPPDRWGAVSQALPWLIVVLLVTMAWLGLTMTDLPNTPHKARLYGLHKSIGLTLLALAVLRLGWRLNAGAPRELEAIPRWQRRIAQATHAALYLLLFVIPLSGWVINSASGFPLRWFGLFRVPALTARDAALNALAKDWHVALFWTLVALASVHAAAALYHHLFQRDATLVRMLPRGWLRSPSPSPHRESPP
jgi:cytochrome b561